MSDDTFPFSASVAEALANVRSCVGFVHGYPCTALVMMDDPVCASCRRSMSPEDLAEVDA